jgi:flagellar protein FliO/FliZ
MRHARVANLLRMTAAAICAAVAPFSALAAAAPPVTEPLGTGSVLQLTLSLGAVVAAIFGLGWLLRRVHGLPGSTHRALRVVATLPVGTRERIAIVQAGDTQVLIGLSPGRIQTLHVLERPVGAAAAPAAAVIGSEGAEPQGAAPLAFKSVFDRERAR